MTIFPQITNIKLYLVNSWWLILEHLFKAVLSLFVIAKIASYLGTSQFGILSYALAIFGLLVPVCKLGFDGVMVKLLTVDPHIAQSRATVAFQLITVSSLAVQISMMFYALFIEADKTASDLILLLSAGMLLNGFFIIDFIFQAKLQAKQASLAKMLAFLLSCIIKLYLIYIKANVQYFAISYTLDSLILACIYIFFLYNSNLQLRLHFFKKINKKVSKEMLTASWPMMLSGLAGVLLIKIDLVMINMMLGADMLGIYAASSRIFEGWISLMYVVSVSALPLIIKIKSSRDVGIYEQQLKLLFLFVFWSSVVFALAVTFSSKLIMQFVYGESYISGASSLVVLSWASVFVALGYMSSRYLIVENKQHYIAIRNFIALIINVILNYFLIPKFGISGSAIATLISMMIVHYALDFFSKDLRSLFMLKTEAMLLRLKNGNSKG